MRRYLLVLAALSLGWAALLTWALRQPQSFHCWCCATSCNLTCVDLTCVDCCDGASPSGCPLPSAEAR